MSIGLGILIATLIVVTAWQIEKRQAWALWRKFGIRAAIAIVAIGLLLSARSLWAPLSNYLDLQKSIETAKNNGTGAPLKYWGLTLGMSPAEVRYLKGPADKEEINGEDKDIQWYYYKSSERVSGYFVVFYAAESNKVAQINCWGPDSECDPIAGIHIGTSESEVRDTLGDPAAWALIGDSGIKSFWYGPFKPPSSKGAYATYFQLQRNRVWRMGVMVLQ